VPRPIDPAREEARARGDKRYVSSKACPHSHVGERFVISTACCVCADIKRAARLGKPVKKTPRQIAERQAEYVEAAKVRFNRPAFTHALAEYHHSQEARARSRYLDRLVKKLTASAIKKVPKHDKENA
jgi:hypothetical protein